MLLTPTAPSAAFALGEKLSPHALLGGLCVLLGLGLVIYRRAPVGTTATPPTEEMLENVEG